MNHCSLHVAHVENDLEMLTRTMLLYHPGGEEVYSLMSKHGHAVS
jgi:hypothetical protein